MIILAAGAASAIMLLAGCLLLVYVLMRKAYLQQESQRRSRMITDVHPLPPPSPPWSSSDGDSEMALPRDLNGQLSTKIIVLEQLIADSQRQIERMEELLERIEAAKNKS